jgi:signal transduction histidine kinase/DNA-binding NarL/FixJ family response regulator
MTGTGTTSTTSTTNDASTTSTATAQRRLDTLTAMAADLAGHFELAPLLERVLRHTMELLGCDCGSVCTVDEAAGTYRKEVDLGVVCEAGRTFPLAEGVTGAVVRARAPVVLDEYAQVPGGHIPEPERSALHGVIGVPLRWNGAVIGTCVVFSRDPGRRFTPDDAALLELFATHAAIAITNARLHAQAAERAAEAAAATERERVVRDVHDTVGRALAAVLLHLDAAGRGLGPGDADAARSLAAARAAARAALAETRRTALGLGPSLLDGRSLAEALALELAWAESTAGLAARLVTVGEPRPLAPDVARQLFRIVQEALTNVVEHAGATSVRVGLVYGDTAVSALVEDDGRGFDPQDLRRGRPASGRGTTPGGPPGLGLRGLAARAQHLGGAVAVDSTPGWGTRVRADVPYAPDGVGARRGSGERWRVLVVHPSPVVRAGLVRMLESTEPDVQVVAELADPAQAVEAYGLLHPHVVLTPLHMPHVDGVQLTSYLRAADPHAAVVLVVDSVADDRVRDAAAGGAVGFVGHDVDAGGLARAVVAAARGDQLVAADLFAARTPAPAALRRLTPREQQVRALLEQGLAYKQVATRLGISIKTVEKHVGAILRKTGAPNRAALHALASR